MTLLLLLATACSTSSLRDAPPLGRYELRDASDPPSGLPFPELLSANMESTVCDYPNQWSPMEPFDLGAGLDLSETIKAEGRSATFTLSMDTSVGVVDADCRLNASADFFCWAGQINRSEDPAEPLWHYVYGWVLNPGHNDALFGAWLTGSNEESLTACPHRRMWAAEWVGGSG